MLAGACLLPRHTTIETIHVCTLVAQTVQGYYLRVKRRQWQLPAVAVPMEARLFPSQQTYLSHPLQCNSMCCSYDMFPSSIIESRTQRHTLRRPSMLVLRIRRMCWNSGEITSDCGADKRRGHKSTRQARTNGTAAQDKDRDKGQNKTKCSSSSSQPVPFHPQAHIGKTSNGGHKA